MRWWAVPETPQFWQWWWWRVKINGWISGWMWWRKDAQRKDHVVRKSKAEWSWGGSHPSPLKWQLTATERGNILKSDSIEMRGSQKVVARSGEGTPSVRWLEEKERNHRASMKTVFYDWTFAKLHYLWKRVHTVLYQQAVMKHKTNIITDPEHHIYFSYETSQILCVEVWHKQHECIFIPASIKLLNSHDKSHLQSNGQ